MTASAAAHAQISARLQASPFFAALSEPSLTFLAGQARLARHEAGALIFSEGEPSQGLFWLQTGALKAVKYAASGREQILHLVEPGQTFNEAGAFTTLPNPATVVALEPAQVWHIPAGAIRQLMRQDPDFAQRIINVLAERLRASANLIEDLSLRPVTGRLARLILDEADGVRLHRPAWYTQSELAARLGTVGDVANRALRQLEGQGLIAVDRQSIQIIDRDGLIQLAQ